MPITSRRGGRTVRRCHTSNALSALEVLFAALASTAAVDLPPAFAAACGGAGGGEEGGGAGGGSHGSSGGLSSLGTEPEAAAAAERAMVAVAAQTLQHDIGCFLRTHPQATAQQWLAASGLTGGTRRQRRPQHHAPLATMETTPSAATVEHKGCHEGSASIGGGGGSTTEASASASSSSPIDSQSPRTPRAAAAAAAAALALAARPSSPESLSWLSRISELETMMMASSASQRQQQQQQHIAPELSAAVAKDMQWLRDEAELSASVEEVCHQLGELEADTWRQQQQGRRRRGQPVADDDDDDQVVARQMQWLRSEAEQLLALSGASHSLDDDDADDDTSAAAAEVAGAAAVAAAPCEAEQHGRHHDHVSADSAAQVRSRVGAILSQIATVHKALQSRGTQRQRPHDAGAGAVSSRRAAGPGRTAAAAAAKTARRGRRHAGRHPARGGAGLSAYAAAVPGPGPNGSVRGAGRGTTRPQRRGGGGVARRTHARQQLEPVR
jgi:hypothetical protein